MPCDACRRNLRLAGVAAAVNFRAVARFDGVARLAVHELKYSGHHDIATVMGPLMALEGLGQDLTLIPVPLHSARQRSRGYNQSRLLADNIAKVTKARVVHNRLRRTRNTLDQIALDRVGRRNNVSGAFGWRGEPINTKVTLVDDVLTTGSTLCACTDALHEVGMEHVEAVVFACAYHPNADTVPGSQSSHVTSVLPDYEA